MKLQDSDQTVARKIIVCLGLLVAVFAVYSPVLGGQFLWDDSFLVVANPLIRSPVLALEVFRHFLFENSVNEFYRPVQTLTYIVDYWRAGLDAPAYHFTNLVIHAANGFLVFFLALRLLEKIGSFSRTRSFCAATFLSAIWLLHPVHSAIAAYISGRADSLALLGLLAGWLCWDRGVETRRGGKFLFLLAFVFTLAGCCSKEIALAGLGFFLAHLWLLRREIKLATKIKTTAGVLVIFLTYLILRHLPEANHPEEAAAVVGGMDRVHLFFRAMGDYVRLLVWPDKLFMERQVSQPTGLFTDAVKNDSLFPWLGMLGGGFLAVLAASLFWRGKGQKLRGFGALWFFVMILPVSNLFTLNATVAEHWLYIPSLGWLFWMFGCWSDLPHKLRLSIVWLAPVCLLALAFRAHARAADWHDPITFYRATIREGGDSIRMRTNLAGEVRKLGNIDEAEKIYRSVVHARPDYAPARKFLAQMLMSKDRVDEALILLPSVKSDASPDVQKLREDYKNHPNSWAAAKGLADAWRKDRPLASLQVVRGFASRNWWHAESHVLLGELAAALSQPDLAITAYLDAARLDVRDAESLNHAAAILGDSGQLKQAIEVQKRAVQRDPSSRQTDLLDTLERMAVQLPEH